MGWVLALVLAVAAGVACGSVAGGLVAGVGTNSFVTTLAMSTAITGIEQLVTGGEAIYSDLPQGLIDLGQGKVLGINAPIVIALGAFIIGYLLLEQTQTGRRMYAVGGNMDAAWLAGIRVVRLRWIGFVLTGMAAAITGIVMSAQTGSYTLSQGVGLLLPAYAAVFLGSTVIRRGLFNIPGTFIGVLFLGVIQNGLILVGLKPAWVNITQGGILLFAILLSRIGSRE
jgi:ribose transport system permease protein